MRGWLLVPVILVCAARAPLLPPAHAEPALLFKAPDVRPTPESTPTLAIPAAGETDRPPVARLTGRVFHVPDSQIEELPPQPGSSSPSETDALDWWNVGVLQPMRAGVRPIPVDAGVLMALTVNHSQKVDAVREVTMVRRAIVDERCAAFDPSLFADSIFDSTSDPVGNTLTTGGPLRLLEDDWGTNAGLRRTTQSGATWRLSQQIGLKDSNSLFFDPAEQASSRLVVGVTKPLMQGRGRAYNTSLIVAANFQSAEAQADYFRVLQEQLAQVAEAYWSLFVQRATLLQRQRHLARAVSLSDQLRQRRELDSLESQVMRADAAVATRRAELMRAEADIRNIESRLRALTNAPALCDALGAELVPATSPLLLELDVDLCDQVRTALEHRPEIDAIRSSVGAAAMRVQVAENELLPSLDLVLEAYAAGLQGDYRLGQSWVDQFSVGPPGYNAGVRFAAPLGNRAAKARYRQRIHQQRRLERLLAETLDTIRAEVEVAVRSLQAAAETAAARRQSLAAVRAELAFVEDRWKLLRGDEALGRLQLEDLLNAQDRHLQEELLYVRALADFQQTLVELQRATGTLAQPAPCAAQLDACPDSVLRVSASARADSAPCKSSPAG